MKRLHRALLDSRDPNTADAFFADGFRSHNNPPGFPPGLAGVKQFFAMFGAAFPDAQVRIDDMVAEGDRVAIATTLIGTHARQGPRHLGQERRGAA